MFHRRQILRFIASATAASQLPVRAFALDYPTKMVRVMVTTAPGGTSDIVTRLTARFLESSLGQTFLVENRPGAGGNLAADVVYRAPPDGYTLLSISKGNVLANLLYDNLGFDFMRDFVPVAGIANGGLTMLMHPSVPVKKLPEFLAYARANPTKINYSTPGNGSDPHLCSELLKMMTGIQMTHVPYRGGALALTDLIAGNVQVMFSNLPVGEYIRSGKLIGLGVTGRKPSPEFPELPPIADAVPGYEVDVWFAYAAHKDTPPDIVGKLNGQVNAALADPKIIAGLAPLNATPLAVTPAELGKLFAAEIDKWGKVIKFAKIKPE
ncbi:tripartite tricarboxylate transporter substrate binding protein [Roseiarcaceae bacterium H3SJ34-1]|uniref:Bug family tripartite tricarboxylate transporter substrate binding protein n=1 Tax=Terripilifer ovatus TaxID=3032367 RepID=UPI003AB92899|nr:tripartite tricarboxylate transporter substrate binding protein [Roseiarcaceae bacterium H3SJ34-1]